MLQRLQGQLASFEAWGLYRGPGYIGMLDQNSDHPLPVQDMRITPELFPLLGLQVVLGRPLASDDAIDANPDVAVIGHDLWLTRFGGTPDVLGKSFELRPGRTVTVVGVAAPGSDVPGNRISFPIVWHPIRVSERAAPNLRFTVLARLKAGRPISAANAEIAARPPLTDPNSGANRPVGATLLLDHIVGDSQRVLWVFFGAVTCVLLIGVANLVSLQLVRNAGRERELGRPSRAWREPVAADSAVARREPAPEPRGRRRRPARGVQCRAAWSRPRYRQISRARTRSRSTAPSGSLPRSCRRSSE